MAFPQTPLPLKVELDLSGTWTDVTADVRSDSQIRISRGRSSWAQQVEAGQCSFALSDTDGKYSPRNPAGTYYGQIGRNTPVRVSVGTGTVALALPGADADYATTPDAAALDVVGDIDVRFDATLLNWYLADAAQQAGSTSVLTELIGKYNQTGDQRSWVLYTQYGYLKFAWSTDGTSAGNLIATATEPLPVPASGRLAVRATMDVNDGSGGLIVRFYTSDSISGTWTQLGNNVTAAFTTSIYASTADLRIGNAVEGTDSSSGFMPALGRVHAAQVRDGIDGTIVANPDYTAQTSGTTSFADSAGRTWTLAGAAEITNRKTRFVGEVSSWTPEWTTGGFDAICRVEASGVLRRMGAGATPAKSPMYREFTNPARTGIVAYWPMEDGADSTSLASALDGHQAMTITGTVTPAAYSDWAASDAICTVGTGSLRATVPNYTAGSYLFLRVFAGVPAAGVVSTQRLLSFTQSGTAVTWSVYVNTSGDLDLRAYAMDGTQVLSTGFAGTHSINGAQKSIGVELTQSGSDISYRLFVYDVTASTLDSASFTSTSGTLAAYTVGRCTEVRFGEDGAMNGTALGHLAVSDSNTGFASTSGALLGWSGETAAARVHRLGLEEDITAYATAPGDERMGVQARDTILNLVRAAGDVDEGILAEQRDVLGLRLVQRASMYNQTAALTLNYAGTDGLVAPIQPTEDDQTLTNDVTVARSGGSSARTMQTTGALSTAAPPTGVGVYDSSYTLNLYDDTQPQYHAGWRLHLGTWDETRFPVITVNLAAAPASIDSAAEVGVGSRMQVTNPPVWLPPGPLDLLVQGYTETMDQYTWSIDYNCTPAGPWTVAVADDTSLGKADTAGAELAAAMTSTATTAYVLTTTEPLWTTDAAQYPFDLRVGGEVMTATACTSSVSDAFGRTTSNGWGAADIGGTWSVVGSAADFAVGSGYGSATQPSTGVAHLTLLTAPGADVDLYVDVATSALATGASLFAGPLVRAVDNSNFYMARLDFTTSAGITMTLRKRVAGVETSLGTYTTGLTHVAGTFYRVRLQAFGTALKAKVWTATDPEPGYWHIEVTDSSLSAAASVGTRSYANTGNTNVSPQLQFDNFTLVNPQTFTVTRSVNGVVKAQAAATSLSLAQPAVAAL